MGPFDGVPIVIKDQFDTIGLTVRSGLPLPKHDPCTKDSAMTERIKAQGMIIIGFTNMHQIGYKIKEIVDSLVIFEKFKDQLSQKDIKAYQSPNHLISAYKSDVVYTFLFLFIQSL